MKNILFSLILFWSFSIQAFVILIDPGHGGKELGAVTTISLKNSKGKTYKTKIYEKDLTLKLAKRIKSKLDKHFSTYLTRSFDRTVSLEDRAAMADVVKADLFISIHFNSSTARESHGFETYYLDNHADKAIKKVEAIENKGLDGESKIVNHILIDLVIKQTVGTSKKLANSIHAVLGKEINIPFKVRDRGIKPGLFYVLAWSKRPGVLIEAGFMSNPKEIFTLRSRKYLEAYADAITTGILNYHATLPKKEIPLF